MSETHLKLLQPSSSGQAKCPHFIQFKPDAIAEYPFEMIPLEFLLKRRHRGATASACVPPENEKLFSHRFNLQSLPYKCDPKNMQKDIHYKRTSHHLSQVSAQHKQNMLAHTEVCLALFPFASHSMWRQKRRTKEQN